MKYIQLLEKIDIKQLWWHADINSSRPEIKVSIAWDANVFGGDPHQANFKERLAKYLSMFQRSKYIDQETSNSIDIVLKDFNQFLEFRRGSDKMLEDIKNIAAK